MNEQRKADIERLRKIGGGSPLEWNNALQRQLLQALACLEFMEEHGATVKAALDAETANPNSPVSWNALIAAFRAVPVLE